MKDMKTKRKTSATHKLVVRRRRAVFTTVSSGFIKASCYGSCPGTRHSYGKHKLTPQLLEG